MYSMKPFHDFSSGIVLPTCMYPLKGVCDVKVLQASAAAAPGKDVQMEELLTKQNALLERLKSLQEEVACQLAEKASSKTITEVVICMDPSHPPSSILLTQSILSSIHPILISSFIHSSVTSTNRQKIKIHPSPHPADRNNYKYGITYIWKKAPNLPTLLLHPSHQIAIMGECNIVKFLFSFISPHHANHPDAVVMTTICDDAIDAIESFKITGSPSLQEILTSIEKVAQPQTTTTTPSPSLLGTGDAGALDVLLWCTVQTCSVSSKSLPKSLQSWLQAFGRSYGGK